MVFVLLTCSLLLCKGMIEELLGMSIRIQSSNKTVFFNTVGQPEGRATRCLTNDVPWSLQGVTQPEPRGK